jgi:hypothetical protein
MRVQVRSAAKYCGELGGVAGFITAYFNSTALTALAGEFGWANGGFYLAIAIAIVLPVAAIVGGHLAPLKNKMAGILMAISTAGIALLFGLTILSAISMALTAAGACLALLSRSPDAA